MSSACGVSVPPNKPIQIVCELANVKVTAKDAQVIEGVLADVVRKLYPHRQIRGLWVHMKAPDA